MAKGGGGGGQASSTQATRAMARRRARGVVGADEERGVGMRWGRAASASNGTAGIRRARKGLLPLVVRVFGPPEIRSVRQGDVLRQRGSPDGSGSRSVRPLIHAPRRRRSAERPARRSDLMADSPSTRTAPKAVPAPRDQHLRDMADCIRFPVHGRRAAGQERPSRRAHGHGRHRHRAVQGLHAVRCGGAALDRPRPVHPVERPRLDAALQPALPDRLQGHDGRGAEAVPPGRQQDRRPPGIPPRRRHRD